MIQIKDCSHGIKQSLIINPKKLFDLIIIEKYQHLDENAIKLCTSVGLATTQYTTIGVYNYRITNGPDSMNTCSVIVNPGPKVIYIVFFMERFYKCIAV